jgi:hypothetical protein
MKIISIHRNGICIDLPNDIDLLQLQPMSASDRLTPFTAVATNRPYNFVCFLDIRANEVFTVEVKHSGLFTVTSIATLKVLEVQTVKTKSLSKERKNITKYILTCEMKYNQKC